MGILAYAFMAWIAVAAILTIRHFQSGRIDLGDMVIERERNPLRFWAVAAFFFALFGVLFTFVFVTRDTPNGRVPTAQDLRSTELAFSALSRKRQSEIIDCLLENPTGGLRLRDFRDAPDVVANQILHVLIRVTDEGSIRRISVFIRPDAAGLYASQERAVKHCAR
ncbi:MAG: hypothetical protein Q7J32_12020 [Sphingomonadaceae bacterium]|nr:hypothetical protein [Sphingomonadaceae bacterium]